jgi:hypothetical protein
MGQILLEFDNTLEFSDIIMPLLSSSPAEGGDGVRPNVDKLQTSVFGIQVPLISINSTVIDFDSVNYFSLSCEGPVPTLSMMVEDKYQLIQNVDKPRQDNEVRIQILPRFDDAYKKINMTFHIASINVVGQYISMTCTYKVPPFISSRIEAMGELDTYTLFKKAATDTGLGFATNIAQGDDIRYVYCCNKSWEDLLIEEIQQSGKDQQMLDWWVDYWNNINLVDIYDRYTTIDKDDDMMIWIAGELKEMDVDNDVKPQQVVATVHDHPGHKNSELYVTDYQIKTNPGTQAANGSDKVLLTRTLQPRTVLGIGVSAAGTSSSGQQEKISVAVDTSRTWNSESYVIGGNGSASGKGNSVSDALTVSQAAASAGEEDVWVSGYIVGGDLTSTSAVYKAPFTSRTNLLLGPRSSTSSRASCISVSLPSGHIRDDLNLVDNPSMLGRKVCLRGDIVESYYGMPGLRNLTDFELQ